MNLWAMLISGTLGTLGFTLIFRTNPRLIPAATLGGFLSTGLYILFDSLGANLFISNFIAMACAGFAAEILARILHAPAAVFLLPAAIPLVPGGSLYYTMSNLIFGNTEAFMSSGASTIMTGLGIAAGMITSSMIFAIISKSIALYKKEKQ